MTRNSPQAERLDALRIELKARGLDGFIVPRTDEYQGEYIPPSAERLAWLTGFTGSAGMAVILSDKAAVFVDGRYTLQVRTEVPDGLYDYLHLISNPTTDWVTSEIGSNKKLGYDPWLMTPRQVERFTKALGETGCALVSVESNPIDAIWSDQPDPPTGVIVPHELQFSGRESTDKCKEIASQLEENGLNCAIISKPESVAWLLNIRGSDLDHTPLPLSFAIAHSNPSIEWFVNPSKISPDLMKHLSNTVSVSAQESLENSLEALGQNSQKVCLNADSTPYWIVNKLKKSGAQVVYSNDPCELPKAKKNEQELNGMRTAHHRDGVAMARFLCWLDKEVPKQKLSELDIVNHLEALRSEGENFKGLSFDTISGSGPNGAIVHYRVTEDTNRKLDQNSLLLVDSGGQYLDGTTDITRTIAIGKPSDEMRDNFTRVLQGHIALAMARFPKGTTGSQLDPFARQALWQAGLDYDHGTGHGVGSYLNVHEGPQRISKAASTVALEPGMIISNEPGYYKTDAYGIRIENLVAVREHSFENDEDLVSLEFETLTKAPIDLRLINAAMLKEFEMDWLNKYHASVFSDLHTELDEETSTWLKAATQPIT
jgi:Xaa-Pro aminopeptidase